MSMVPGQGPEQRESEKTTLSANYYLVILLYIIIKLLIMENHPSLNRKWNDTHQFQHFLKFANRTARF